MNSLVMIMITFIKVHLLLFFIAYILDVEPNLVSAQTLVPKFPVALPNCTDQCGNISIPYPFSTTPECYKHLMYWVTCNETFNPPRLFLQNSTITALNISLTGHLRVMMFIATECYYAQNIISSSEKVLRMPNLFTINNQKNKFTVVGCDSYGYFSGWRLGERYFSTGCITTCREEGDLDESCTGIGCCQITSIPDDIISAELTLGSLNNHTDVKTFNNCSYGLIVEESSFTFHRDYLTSLSNVPTLPMVLDWTIGNETCELALNSSTYACRSQNSHCDVPSNGQGYICICNTGYEGNPYLADHQGGCQDIDECSFHDPKLHNCKSKCVNTPGGFMCECPKGYLIDQDRASCHCPQGYQGDATREGGCSPDKSDSKTVESHIYKPIAATLLGTILVGLLTYLVYYELKRRRLEKMKHIFFLQNGGKLLQEKLQRTGNMMSIGMEREMSSNNDVAKIFSSAELHHATNNFHSDMIVGQGGFGTVYKGFLQDKRLVAIKKSKEIDPTQIDQFVNEVAVLSRVSHRNIVKLLGCCLETQVPLLVYEFINNGTLHDHIHNQARRRFLDWDMRLKIASETADVLSYLHSAASTPIIHRDVKSANILLDHNFEAKVSDFGASRLVPIDQAQLSTMVQGTFGYLDPEYMQTNQLTEKSDVYSFGVVLLELITGMKPLSYNRPEEERNLTNFFLCKLQQGCLSEAFDETTVGDEENMDQLNEVAQLAKVCINVKGKDRPSMKEVAMELQGLRSGGKHSWVKFEPNMEESFNGQVLDGFVDDNGYSTSIGYISFKDQEKLNGGR